MPPTLTTEGLEAAARIAAASPDVGVLVLSQHVEAHYAVRLLAIGRANLDGTGANQRFITGAFSPQGVAVDAG